MKMEKENEYDTTARILPEFAKNQRPGRNVRLPHGYPPGPRSLHFRGRRPIPRLPKLASSSARPAAALRDYRCRLPDSQKSRVPHVKEMVARELDEFFILFVVAQAQHTLRLLVRLDDPFWVRQCLHYRKRCIAAPVV